MKIISLILIVLSSLFLWYIVVSLDTIIKQKDCQSIISAYQHSLEKEIKDLQKWETAGISDYDVGWKDALRNVLNLLE